IMSQGNQTAIVTEFFIVGFPGLQPLYYDLMATTFFIIYVTIVAGNILLIVLFVKQHSLQKPMYITMVSLALSDIGFCTVALPKIIARYWFNAGAISVHVCLFQRLLIHYFGTLSSVILLIMALDRYMAICFPLRYSTLMTNRVMGLLHGLAWVTSMVSPSITTIMSSQMSFCGPNQIVNCFCDSMSVSSLACGNVSMQVNLSTSLAMFVLLLPFSLIMLSYVHIITAVLRIDSKEGYLKTFSTCITHVCIIGVYYIPRFFVYLTPYLPIKINTDMRIGLILIYSLLPPLVNPIIYSFRTKEIREIFHTWFQRRNAVSPKFKIMTISK
uniref:Olfactory receptor n=1 Tax=Scleropages formosus TaxID=113540 RepID=A0A8C9UYU4_SCLFO